MTAGTMRRKRLLGGEAHTPGQQKQSDQSGISARPGHRAEKKILPPRPERRLGSRPRPPRRKIELFAVLRLPGPVFIVPMEPGKPPAAAHTPRALEKRTRRFLPAERSRWH